MIFFDILFLFKVKQTYKNTTSRGGHVLNFGIYFSLKKGVFFITIHEATRARAREGVPQQGHLVSLAVERRSPDDRHNTSRLCSTETWMSTYAEGAQRPAVMHPPLGRGESSGRPRGFRRRRTWCMAHSSCSAARLVGRFCTVPTIFQGPRPRVALAPPLISPLLPEPAGQVYGHTHVGPSPVLRSQNV